MRRIGHVVAVWSLLGTGGNASAAELLAWVQGPLARVHVTQAAGTASAIDLEAAKGEAEAFQIVLRAEGGPLEDARVAVSDLAGPGGAVLPATRIRLYRQHYVPVPRHSPSSPGDAVRPSRWGSYPDALIPFVDPATGRAPVAARYRGPGTKLTAGRNQPFLADVEVPRDARAGRYTGTWTAQAGGQTRRGTVTLTVWDWSLPEPSRHVSVFSQWNDKSEAATAVLLAHRLQPAYVPPDVAATLVRRGLRSVNSGFWSGANWGNCRMTPPPAVDEVRARRAEFPAGLRIYAYFADEIVDCPQLFPQVKAWARNLHAGGIESLVVTAPVPALLDDGAGTGRPAVDIFAIQAKYHALSPANVRAARARGLDVLSYTALVQDGTSPKWLIDFAPINYRMLPGFLNRSLDLTGTLIWAVDYWQDRPWENVIYAHDDGNAMPGEGMLVYPGADAGVEGVVPSLRLKHVRDGVEDFDMLTLAAERRLPDLNALVASIGGRDWQGWNQDPAALERVRREIGRALGRR